MCSLFITTTLSASIALTGRPEWLAARIPSNNTAIMKRVCMFAVENASLKGDADRAAHLVRLASLVVPFVRGRRSPEGASRLDPALSTGPHRQRSPGVVSSQHPEDSAHPYRHVAQS